MDANKGTEGDPRRLRQTYYSLQRPVALTGRCVVKGTPLTDWVSPPHSIEVVYQADGSNLNELQQSGILTKVQQADGQLANEGFMIEISRFPV